LAAGIVAAIVTTDDDDDDDVDDDVVIGAQRSDFSLSTVAANVLSNCINHHSWCSTAALP